MDGDRNLAALGGQQLDHMYPFEGGCLLGQSYQKRRCVAAENTKIRDRKENEAYVGATPHPFRVLVELGLLNTAWRGFERRGARNVKLARNHGIKGKFRASDAEVVQDTHIHREAVVAVGNELN
jgi:hypothetical protein